MKSNICKLEKGTKSLDEIFLESEKVAVYNELNPKQTLQLRLLCEELVNMLPFIISDFNGEFWMENQGNDYELCVRVSVENMDFDTRERLIKVSKNNKGRKQMMVTCGDYVLQYVDDALPDEFFAGILGCEGRNMFYDFSVTSK